MVYLGCDREVRTLKGKLQVFEAVLESRGWVENPNSIFQASLPGIFFENLGSARHKRESRSKVPGILKEKRREDA